MFISEVEARNKILFGSLSSGISTQTTKKLAWENLALSVNEVGADSRTVADLRKKVVGYQGERKKKGLPSEKRGSDGQRRRSRGASFCLDAC